PPLWKDERFQWGAGVGTVTLLAGMCFSGWGRYIALLDVPAFGFAALVALQWVDTLQGTQKASDKGTRIEARSKKLREQFEQEAGDAKRAMAALDADTPEEAIAALAVVAPLQEKRQGVVNQLTELEQDPEFIALPDKLQQAKSEMEALNAELTEKGGNYFREAREVEREIARTRQSITLAETALGITSEPAVAPEESAEDPSPSLLTFATQLFNTDIAGVSAILKERCAQYLAALSDKKYLGAEIDLRGRATLITPQRKVPASEVSGKDLDLLYLCLKLTVLEKYSARAKVPILIEDGPYVDEAKQALLGRMLRHLGTLTQVLHVTAAPLYAGVADGTAAL
ncbi:MAG: chromosome segregation protein SMC, partial [Myxococcaceae bacterium]